MLPTELYLCEICARLGYYAAYDVNPLPTFRDNLSITSSRVKISFPRRWVGEFISKLRWGIDIVRCVISQKSAVLICFAAKSEITHYTFVLCMILTIADSAPTVTSNSPFFFIEACSGIPQYLEGNTRTVFDITPLQLSFTSLLTDYLLFVI